MFLRKMICIILSCVMIGGMFAVPAKAAENGNTETQSLEFSISSARATGSFSMTIPSKSQGVASSSFSLAAGETVTIKATYSPYNASVDFGLVAPDGTYYYVNATTGSIDKAIQVNESGSYTLQIRNNASYSVIVAGIINY